MSEVFQFQTFICLGFFGGMGGLILLLILRSPIYDVHKKWPTNDPPIATIRKNEQYIYCLK